MCCVAAVEMNNFESMNNFGSDEEGEGAGGGRGEGLSQTTNENLNSFRDSNSENEEEVRKKPSSRGGPPSLDSVEKDAIHNPLQTNNATSSASTEATPLPPPAQQHHQSSLASVTHESMATSTPQSSSAPPSQPSLSQLSQSQPSQPSQSHHQPPKEEEEEINSDSAGAVAHEQLNLLSSAPATAGPHPLDSTLPVSSTASLPSVPTADQSGHQNLVPSHPPSSTGDHFGAPARSRTRVIETADDDGVCSRDVVDALRSPEGLEILTSLLDSGAQVNLPTGVSVCTCVCVCVCVCVSVCLSVCLVHIMGFHSP